MKWVFSNGVFDILHPGHYNLLSKCREIATEDGHVLIAIDSDNKVKQDKGSNRPYFSEKERANNLLSLKYQGKQMVNEVWIFNTNEELREMIMKYLPNTIVKGSDWKDNVVGSDFADEIFYFEKNHLSTTEIERRILEANK